MLFKPVTDLPHKAPVMRESFPSHNFIMISRIMSAADYGTETEDGAIFVCYVQVGRCIKRCDWLSKIWLWLCFIVIIVE